MKELESMERHDMPFICTWNSGKWYENSDMAAKCSIAGDCFFFDLNEDMTEDEAHDSAAWEVLKKLDLQDIYTLIRMTRNPTDPSYQDKEYSGGWIYVLTRKIVSK